MTTGRGTVAAGRIERGKAKKGQEMEILGYGKQMKANLTGLEMFHKNLDEAQAGDNCGLLLRGTKRDEVRRGMVRNHHNKSLFLTTIFLDYFKT